MENGKNTFYICQKLNHLLYYKKEYFMPNTLGSYYVRVIVDNSKCKFDLKFDEKWAEELSTWNYNKNDFSVIPAGEKRSLWLLGSDRGGMLWHMLPYGNNRKFYVRMAFTNPKSSSNNAEGSQFSGLQQYKNHGEPLEITYVIGTPALAGWIDGEQYIPKAVCDFDDSVNPEPNQPKDPKGPYRIKVCVDNTLNKHPLKLKKIWDNNGGDLEDNWSYAPTDIPAGETRTFLLNDNDRAGMIYDTLNPLVSNNENIELRMAFTNPYDSHSNAEGSQLAGLRTYQYEGDKVDLHYQIFSQNTAFWHGCTNYPRPRIKDSSSPNPRSHRNWMKENFDALMGKKLQDLAIPGSHDSTTYALNVFQDGRIATCQDLDLTGQLNMGIRMLDLRVLPRDGQLWCDHNKYWTTPLNKALSQIGEFCRNTDSEEIVMMCFAWRNSEQRNEFSESDDEKVMSMLQKELPGLLITKEEENLTIGELRGIGRKAYVFYDRSAAVEKYPELHRNPVKLYWPNKRTAYDIKYFVDSCISKNKPNKFWVIEGQCTPNWTAIAGQTPYALNVGQNPTRNTSDAVINTDTNRENVYQCYDQCLEVGSPFYFGSTVRVDNWISEEWWDKKFNIFLIDYVG